MADGRDYFRWRSVGIRLNGDVAIAPGEVRKDVYVRCWERAPCQVDDVVALAGADLQANRSAGCEDAWCVGKELTNKVESVDAAIEG